MYKIKIYADVRVDIRNAAAWYENQSEGLGSRFKKQAKAQIQTLGKNALLYAHRYQDVRCMLLKDFPFMVHYWIDAENDQVHVYGFYHTSLSPASWNRGSK
ncbi:hypothetical protein Cpin_4658 [Chitinophaga pinensis DSM 2588]|uniref:Type II toxin-antitoxin system RelE/ParE family toxin n=1 Tax=Chitinophaga pinensis (strain ATCC 43595 / DSM 2588 / LMG 13176 / NBRC 15968 / NCIMB 11800 / UQM 2034) TaxID=485918 RepID=A0A979G7B1_CHIPD|nr:hypothetical protein Cpin_4658 [Chitinophaga pinensis DSM 2588]